MSTKAFPLALALLLLLLFKSEPASAELDEQLTCKASGYCSVGKTKRFKGDISTSTSAIMQ